MARFYSRIACLMLIAYLARPAMSATYTVGDTGGWALGVDYGTWASDKTLKVGDSLVFNYGSSHSVSEVTASDYNSCSSSNALTTDSSGATTIALKTTGKHYFVCGVPGHCDGGMKLAVTVKGATDTATPSGTTTTPSGATTTNPETPTTSTTTTPTSTNNAVPHPASSAGGSLLSPFGGVFVACFGVMFKLILV
ncbi:hypothetical protein Leryth_014029 [Lithospermum erythrorhizon]|nr:hypothetical protein Leryth_014029 [Lithospermum erythrorhizon]